MSIEKEVQGNTGAERLQKIIAQAGFASRRGAEELISLGLVTVNGQVAKLGDKAVFGQDAIKVNGKLLFKKEAPIYLAFNKPKNVISMLADPNGRPNLSDYLSKVRTKVFPIGRLDFANEGLILLTNDGAVAEKIQKSSDIFRVYSVKVKGHPNAEMIARIARGGRVDEKFVKPHAVSLVQDLANKARIQVVMKGASAGDLFALFESRGFLVERIVRTAIGQITLKGLKPGHFRYLTQSQMDAIHSQPELGERVFESEYVREEKEELAATAELEDARENASLKRANKAAPNSSDAAAPRAKVVIKPRSSGDGFLPKFNKPRPEGEFKPRGSRPAFGRDRDSRDSRDGGKPSFKPRGTRPAFGRDEDRPSSFKPRGPRPSFGRDRDSRDGERPTSFKPRGPRRDDDRPSSFKPRGPRPAFGGGRDRDSRDGDRPSFKPRGPRPMGSGRPARVTRPR